jgi:glutamine synthetase adenylyltransferase
MTRQAPHPDILGRARWTHDLDDQGRRRIEALAPIALAVAGAAVDPELTTQRTLDLLEHLSRRPDLLARVAPYPEILPRDPDQLRADVLSMRDRILKQTRGAPDGITGFDVKHSRGGIIDVEFITQYLILRHAAGNPALCEVGDNTAALSLGAALGLLPEGQAQATIDAYRQYRLWMHRERLRGNERVIVATPLAEAHSRAVMGLWRQVFWG